MQELLKYMFQLGLFGAFIYAIIEVIKGICARGIFGIIKELIFAIFKNQPMSVETMRALNFGLALLYCYAFDYGAMSKMMGVTLEDTNNLAWWLDYAGTSSVIYIGVHKFYHYIKKATSGFDGGNTSNAVVKTFAGNTGTSGLPAQS